MRTLCKFGLLEMVEEFKMELSAQQSLHSILTTLNGLHEIQASFRSMGLLAWIYIEDRSSSVFWQRREDNNSVPHFRKRSIYPLGREEGISDKGSAHTETEYEQKSGLTCCLLGRMSHGP